MPWKSILILIKNHAIKTCEGVEVKLRAFLTTTLDGGEWSASGFDSLVLGKKPLIPVGEEACWTPQPVWTRWLEKPQPLYGIETWSPSLSLNEVHKLNTYWRYRDCLTGYLVSETTERISNNFGIGHLNRNLSGEFHCGSDWCSGSSTSCKAEIEIFHLPQKLLIVWRAGTEHKYQSKWGL